MVYTFERILFATGFEDFITLILNSHITTAGLINCSKELTWFFALILAPHAKSNVTTSI